jgi:hypothetical protein
LALEALLKEQHHGRPSRSRRTLIAGDSFANAARIAVSQSVTNNFSVHCAKQRVLLVVGHHAGQRSAAAIG